MADDKEGGNRMVKIAPSVLSADFSQLKEQIKIVEKAGADWIHLDVMDGHYVPNITFGPLVVAGIRKITRLPLDTHLMIENADAHIEKFCKAGSDHITVHVEACPHLWATIDKIHECGKKAGVTLNPATPLNQIDLVLHKVELVLIMTVEPGLGGQTFIEESLIKINELNKIRQERGLDFEIQVDGGIDEKTTPWVVEAGATCLVSGSSIFAQPDIKKAFLKIKDATNVKKSKMTGINSINK